MNWANCKLRSNFPSTLGLQETYRCNSASNQRSPLRPLILPIEDGRICVQFLHERPIHWVWCAASAGVVYFGNTLSTARLRPSLDSQDNLRLIFLPFVDQSGHLPIRILHVQQQKDEVSCGVYCIAFAFLAAAGVSMDDIAHTDFGGEVQLWNWLCTCWAADELMPPPVAGSGNLVGSSTFIDWHVPPVLAAEKRAQDPDVMLVEETLVSPPQKKAP